MTPDLIPLKDIERLKKIDAAKEPGTYYSAAEDADADIKYVAAACNALPSLLAAAECAHRQRVEIERLRELVGELTFPDDCYYDHHGYCQAHSLHEHPCPHQRAKELLAKEEA